jgi:hypothetical protein
MPFESWIFKSFRLIVVASKSSFVDRMVKNILNFSFYTIKKFVVHSGANYFIFYSLSGGIPMIR